VARTFRERPRYALLMGLGLAGLVALGVLAGALLAGGEDSSDPGPSAIEVRQAQQLRAVRLELREAREELDSMRDELSDATEEGERQQARAAGWRRTAQRLAIRNQALRRQLTQAQEDE
jgi:hypothetical protein